MKDYRKLLNIKNIPRHVAIIMDGNGRWAERRALRRTEGHRRATKVIEPLMDAAMNIGISVVSLYAFSTENWSRPRAEVAFLWKLLEDFFSSNIPRIKQKGIKLRHSGSVARLPASTRKVIEQSVRETGGNKKIVLNICLNYGGRSEIVEAVNRWAEMKKPGETLTVEKMNRFLYTAGLTDVDLLIRTSGEHRISNFLLWQSAYAELVFVKTLWPDFRPHHLFKSIYEYQQRERRFGGL